MTHLVSRSDWLYKVLMPAESDDLNRARRILTQRLESLARAGVMQLGSCRRRLLAELPAGEFRADSEAYPTGSRRTSD